MSDVEKKRLSLNQIKRIELDILLALTNFCEEHHLKYFLAYGTLLGAVRHGGFIPWDDDIDLVMLRSDYMKLNELLSKHKIREDLEWISIQNGLWNEPFGKLVNVNTSVEAQRMRTAIWVDVFPMDCYNSRVLKKNIFMRRVHIAKNTNHYTLNKKGIAKFILRILYSWKSFVDISKEIEPSIWRAIRRMFRVDDYFKVEVNDSEIEYNKVYTDKDV